MQILHDYYYRGYDDVVLYLRRLSKYRVEPQRKRRRWGKEGRKKD